MILDKFNLNEEKLNKLQSFMNLVLEKNKVMNLTAIVDENEFYEKHFFDSLLPILKVNFDNKTILDVGSGAGFPGIPLAICFPKSKFVLIEPILKRCKFLEEVIASLKLDNVEILNKRAEECVDYMRECADIVVSRAVSSFNILLELCIPFLKINGYGVFYKGLKYQDEINEACNALKELNSKIDLIQNEKLPLSNEDRFNIIVMKLKETNKKFPRNFSQIKKRPL